MIKTIITFFTFLLSIFHPVAKLPVRGTIQKDALPVQKSMQITSPAFANNTTLPKKYTCEGQGVNPPLVFSDVPANAVSLVLIVSDPDAPRGTYTHWVLFNIPPNTTEISENSHPVGAVQSVTSTGKEGYVAACPPVGTGVHRYIFTLSALDEVLVLTPNMRVADVESSMRGHVIAKATLTGLYPGR